MNLGVLLPPQLMVYVLSIATGLNITWIKPFSPEGFPIISYNLTVYNQSSVSSLLISPLHADNHTQTQLHIATLVTAFTSTSQREMQLVTVPQVPPSFQDSLKVRYGTYTMGVLYIHWRSKMVWAGGGGNNSDPYKYKYLNLYFTPDMLSKLQLNQKSRGATVPLAPCFLRL